MNVPVNERLLKLPQVRDRVALATATIYDKMSKGEFPRPVRIGQRAVAWRESAVQGWIEDRIRAAAANGGEGRL